MTKKYITITEDVHTYNYKYVRRNKKKKIKCQKCRNPMNLVKKRSWGMNHYNETIGYYCNICNLVYISNEFKVLMFKYD